MSRTVIKPINDLNQRVDKLELILIGLNEKIHQNCKLEDYQIELKKDGSSFDVSLTEMEDKVSGDMHLGFQFDKVPMELGQAFFDFCENELFMKKVLLYVLRLVTEDIDISYE